MLCKGPYLVGNAIEVRARPKNGDPVTDASAWRLLVLPPNGTESDEYTMTAVDGMAVGQFTPDAPGRWRYHVAVAAPTEAAIEGYFDVKDRLVPEPL